MCPSFQDVTRLDSVSRSLGPLPALAGALPGRGHNQGPPLVESQWHLAAWRLAHKQAWENPPIEVIRRRLTRAQAPGMTYRERKSVVEGKRGSERVSLGGRRISKKNTKTSEQHKHKSRTSY